MYWGGGYGNRVPDTAKAVAQAFYAGKARKRGNCETDGETYWLEGNAIARRVKSENEIDHFARVLLGETSRGLLEFSFCGWCTEMTCRHLNALGADASLAREYSFGPRGGRLRDSWVRPLLFGRKVDSTGWYSPEYLKSLPEWQHPVWVPPEKTVVRPNKQRAAHAGA